MTICRYFQNKTKLAWLLLSMNRTKKMITDKILIKTGRLWQDLKHRSSPIGIPSERLQSSNFL